ncbi:MAG: hypothetical protein SFY66_19440 [Oculatellaceae cyanobacterium bins.114]|nr:hypothetical protein [Oculatellaceae cyanobacterium bins.114]
MVHQWQVGDRLEGPEPDDQGIISAINGSQLVIQCGEGITIYGRQKTLEKMNWRLVH